MSNRATSENESEIQDVLRTSDQSGLLFSSETWSFVRAILTPLASLRLTVALLVLGVFVTWVATMQQSRMDIWDVKRAHFPAVLTPINFEVLFPPAWFPGLNGLKVEAGADDTAIAISETGSPIPGRFFVPSGFLIIILMLINLTAAHLLRMRIQASGAILVGGLMVMFAGAAATWFVVLGGQNPSGFQVSYDTAFYYGLWIGVQLLMLVLAQVIAVFAWRLPGGRTAARIAGWFGAAAIFAAAITMLSSGQNAFIGDSAMRILWQLIQGSVVAAITLVGCYMVFRRKGGVVLVHIGITMLLANEIFVTLTNQEQQMHLYEGQTSSYAVDIRSPEMFVADMRDQDAVKIMQIPAVCLAKKAKVEDAELPFVVECVDWHANSDLVRVEQGDMPAATDGYGKEYRIVNKRVIDGVSGESNQRNWAAGVVRLLDRKTGGLIGVYLVSQLAEANDVCDTIEVDGIPWQVGLRLKHVYKPYSISLDDVSSENYVGTAIPRTYESTIRLNHAEQGVTDARREIWMNNPLRYGNETFYQTGYERLPDGREYTVLQIVKNQGWMIPYVACMYVVIGLMGHFFSMLVKFLASTAGRSDRLVTANDAKGRGWGARLAFWIPFLIALTFMGSELSKSMRPPKAAVGADKMPLDNFARIPMTLDGRVQPLESLARNTARMFGHRETVLEADGKTRVPALQWLADTIFAEPGHDEYLVFRIEDLNLLGELGLHPRTGFRYSLKELDGARDKIVQALAAAEKLPDEKWNNTQKRMRVLSDKLGRLYGIRAAFADPSQFVGGFSDQTAAVKEIANKLDMPLVVPTGNKDQLWLTLSAAHWMERVHEYGIVAGSDDLNAVSDFIAEKELLSQLRDELIQDQIIEKVVQDESVVAMIKKETGLTGIEAIRQRLSQSFESFPQTIKEMYRPEVLPQVEVVIAVIQEQMRQDGTEPQKRLQQDRSKMRQLVRGIYGKADLAVTPEFAKNYQNLLGLGKAWRDRDGDRFDQLARDHLTVVGANAVDGRTMSGIDTEVQLYRLSPFYAATVLYLIAGLCCALGWIGQRVSFSRAASWIVWLGVAVHLSGLVMRVIVTGRPPVTNLYSSFVFVSMGTVVMLQIVERMTRIGIGSLLGSIFGVLTLLWAFSISVSDGDTMIVLRAVLDTQFWLSTHVICISMGYAATASAGMVGLFWMARSVFSAGMSKSESRDLLRLVYGVTAFALLLSFFGTVLGGLWGDDSWGRFWGWDPKENGALMIVLWNAVPLHARWAGIIRDRGIAALSIVGIVVTIWSWEMVNRLGVGLHSYGDSGRFVSIELGNFAWQVDRVMLMAGIMGVLTLISLAGTIPRRLWCSPAVRD